MIPILDLRAQYHAIRDEITAAVQEVLESGCYILGPNVAALEDEVAQFCGCRYGVGVASGTDALRLAMDAAGIGPGDEVITTPFTFVSTASTVTRAGATLVFVDIEPASFNLDPALVEQAITERTKAILPVHLYGHPADMGRLMDLAGRYGLAVIEDAAQAIGATYKGQKTCSFGIIGCLSFYPTKLLGAYGDAGMAITCNGQMAERLDILRKHGGRNSYRHERLGYNSRLDEVQAAVLRVKLRFLSGWNRRRREIAAHYAALLARTPVTVPRESPDVYHVYQEYTIRAPLRDRLQAFLSEKGIETEVFYPLPLHLQAMYADLGLVRGTFPESERAANEVLSLPMYPELSGDQVEQVADAIRRFYS